MPLLPKSWGRYFEPFVGGGALFFALRPRNAVLTDSNAELVNVYRVVRDKLEALIEELSKHPYDKDHYYEVRAQDPRTLTDVEAAARMIYLNKTAFNGLYRVNKSGRFNVPFGRYSNPKICDRPRLRAASEALRGVVVAQRDFSEVVHFTRPGDFVYFDPPYVPRSATSNFTNYASGGFGLEQQRRLAQIFRELDRAGVKVMLSNSDTDLVRSLYHDFRIDTVLARRAVNSKASARGPITEVVVRNYA